MKTCQVDGCFNPVWGKMLCKNHQYLRVDKKPKPLKLIRDKEYPFGFSNQQSMFEWLWEKAKDKNGNVICPYTKEVLNRFYGTELWWSCFAHILPKGKYTYFKLNPENIQIIFPEFHRLTDQGTLAERKKHPEWNFGLWYAKVFEMKQKYQNYKKENLLR